MPVHQFIDLTWEDVRDIPQGTVALLPMGAVEAHGPHLPLGTDVIIAEAMASASARRLATSERTVLVLPTIAYTPAPFATAFPGTLAVRPETVTAQVVDLARALTRQGFEALILVNAHFDPAQVTALSTAIATCDDEQLLPVVFPDITRKSWAARLGEEFASGACHAGRYEGSIVLAARPDLVRTEIMEGLEPNPVSLSVAIREGSKTFEDAGGKRAYFGVPAEATAAEGSTLIDTLAKIVVEAYTAEAANP